MDEDAVVGTYAGDLFWGAPLPFWRASWLLTERLPMPDERKANGSFSVCEEKLWVPGPADARRLPADRKAASAARLSKGPAEWDPGAGPKWVFKGGYGAAPPPSPDGRA
jgi:hypothetical protein